MQFLGEMRVRRDKFNTRRLPRSRRLHSKSLADEENIEL